MCSRRNGSLCYLWWSQLWCHRQLHIVTNILSTCRAPTTHGQFQQSASIKMAAGHAATYSVSHAQSRVVYHSWPMVDIIWTWTWEDAWRARLCSHCGSALAAAALSRCDNRDRACGKRKRKLSRLKLTTLLLCYFKIFLYWLFSGAFLSIQITLVLHSGLLTHAVVGTGLVGTYGMPNPIQIAIPASHRKLRGLCGETADPECSPVVNGSACASAWSLSPPGKNSQECDPVGVQFHHSSCFLIW